MAITLGKFSYSGTRVGRLVTIFIRVTFSSISNLTIDIKGWPKCKDCTDSFCFLRIVRIVRNVWIMSKIVRIFRIFSPEIIFFNLTQ